MLAARFRSVYWVALASVAGLSCYLVTQRVAAERIKLETLDRDIQRTRLSIRSLETEIGTRGSMSQMERWNSEVLDLRAANSAQIVHPGVQLASLSAGAVPPAPGARPVARAVQPAGVVLAKTEAPAPRRAAPAAAPQEPLLRNATYVRPAGDRMTPLPQRVAMRGDGPLAADTLAELNRLARGEAGGRGRARP